MDQPTTKVEAVKAEEPAAAVKETATVKTAADARSRAAAEGNLRAVQFQARAEGQQLAQARGERPNRWSRPADDTLGGRLGHWGNAYTTPFAGTEDGEFRLLDDNRDGVLDPSEKRRHYDNNGDGRLDGRDDLNGDGWVNPFENWVS